MVTVKNISDFIDKLAPYNTMCTWDNCGILIGDRDAAVSKIGFALDLTPETLSKAEDEQIDLLVTHHPVIFHAKKDFLYDDLVFKAAVKGINVISAHTCFDCADGGVNDVLSQILGIDNIRKTACEECSVAMIRTGSVKPVSPEDFARFVADKLGTTVRLVDAGKEIRTVSVCGGAGMDFIDDVIAAGSDAYVTGDIRHHEMLYAAEKGITVIAAGHFETENPAMTAMKNYVQKQFMSVECILLEQTNPVKFVK